MLPSIRLPKSALQILQFLTTRGPLPPRVISKETNVPLRTVTFALDRLVGTDLCEKVPNLDDMRCTLYVVNQKRARFVFSKYGMVAK